MIIGRGSHNEIAVYHDSLSRKHAMVMFLDGKFLLNDLGSTNGDLEFRFELAKKS